MGTKQGDKTDGADTKQDIKKVGNPIYELAGSDIR